MNQMKIVFSADLINEGFARNSVTSFIMYLNPTVDEVVEIKTIVSEAVTNAIIHGYMNDSSKEVYLETKVEDRMISIIIEDFGCGIEDIQKASVPLFSTSPDEEHAGMGISIIEALADDLIIESKKDKGTKLVIIKKLKENDGQ